MLPSVLARQLQKGIGNYIETTFPMTNAPFKGSVAKMLARKNAIGHEPYMAIRLPFRMAERMPDCFEAIEPAFLPYVHQQKAFERLTGDDGRSTLIATGTGSGKTECFLYPILEYCYQHRGELGIKALLIYPMNALATDQAKRIAQLIQHHKKLRGEVTVGMYVGGLDENHHTSMGEDHVITDRNTLLERAPDILMTNYKMLDYLLVRPKDAQLWQDNDSETLKYIAVDELHTFDGAQGTDLACLLRRLKRRLKIEAGHLCCVGTSATMGTEENSAQILEYARGIFGEPFDQDAIITEDRLSPSEFLGDIETNEEIIPTAEEAKRLSELSDADDITGYLQYAARIWMPHFDNDIMSDEGRLKLAHELMRNEVFHNVIRLTGGRDYQISQIIEEFSNTNLDWARLPDASAVMYALYALISHARTGCIGHLRPFLNVQVQLWLRELRRLVAKVDAKDMTYEIAQNLNKEQSQQYLPVVNCRDCGMTGWLTINKQQHVAARSLEQIYRQFFNQNAEAEISEKDCKLAILYPHHEKLSGMHSHKLCPSCMQIQICDDEHSQCEKCNVQTIHVQIPIELKKKNHPNHDNASYICPCCGSANSLSLMGLRSATLISAAISQLFASKFNDDKKTLAFSDNVQDAAHRAGFFNARTWRFGLRGAIQKYCDKQGNGQNLQAFQQGFIQYWRQDMTDDKFISFFTPHNMTWMHAYESLVQNRNITHPKLAQDLIDKIAKRLKYEIMLEFGIASKIGRTLPKSNTAVLSFYPKDIVNIANAVRERTINECGVLRDESPQSFERMVVGYLHLLQMRGAFQDSVFDKFVETKGDSYCLTNKMIPWLPGIHGSRLPKFIVHPQMYTPSVFDSCDALPYKTWINHCRETLLADESHIQTMCKIILEEAIKLEVIVPMPTAKAQKVYGLNKTRVFISKHVVPMQCHQCGAITHISQENLDFWQNSPCFRHICSGKQEKISASECHYYGKLFRTGDLFRINAHEHTGLLERSEREQVEIDFKRNKDNHAIWDPNVLSCTPTLEMGIDIGDLSTVILCSIPPAQSQFMQRAGRAGRKDGNALTLAVANARPHDLYYYTDPLEMISGIVTPPKIFLRASAVLERQFIAFCMDSWVRSGIPESAIPDKLGIILTKWDHKTQDLFPQNFLNFIKTKITKLLNSFIQMFDAYLDDHAREDIRRFARGADGAQSSQMFIKISDAFESMKKQQNALKESLKTIKEHLKDIENKPKDSSHENEIKSLKSERNALLNVLQEISNKNIFNFLSDEGLLPNYAFPEAGITLRAVLYRKEEETNHSSQTSQKYQKTVYEYNRSASSAISEFAPDNTFYADGRKFKIDQVDLTTAQSAKWRLCPNCSHAQLEESCKHKAACPKCGCPEWADIGQVRTMLKVQMVYSNVDYKELINDDSEDRNSTFYIKQLYVDVDEDNDIEEAYQMNNEDFPFGYEFVRKATLREINFGKTDTIGEKMSVSGSEEIRKGFKICKHCGKIQPEPKKNSKTKPAPIHSFACKAKKNPKLMQDCEECLFLFREFQTEILRLLVPATTMEASIVKQESFVAMFMLGMKQYFGNVDHLRATVCDVPITDSDTRKHYLVIYDSVPGGTGYLKQLLNNENALMTIFEKALQVLESCPCKEDPNKDGCYHCLYAYRQSKHIGSISRTAAIKMLKSILSGKDQIQKIDKLSHISIDPLLESAAEAMFLETIREKISPDELKPFVRNGKHSYYFKLNEQTWEIEPQVPLDVAYGINNNCKSRPDFILWNTNSKIPRTPVAVFIDGFRYHKNKVAEDTKKREAIRRTGNFYVWSLSCKDLQTELYQQQSNHRANTLFLAPEISNKQYPNHQTIPNLATLSPFKMLMEYLQNPNAEELFKKQTQQYALHLVRNFQCPVETWKTQVTPIQEQTHFIEDIDIDDISENPTATLYSHCCKYTSHETFEYFSIDTCITKTSKYIYIVCAQLKDDPNNKDDLNHESDNYEKEWNGFLHFCNFMQFIPNFIAVSSTGLSHSVYYDLPIAAQKSDHLVSSKNENSLLSLDLFAPQSPQKTAWKAFIEGVEIDNEAKCFIDMVKEFENIPVPPDDALGYEIGDGEQVEIAWPDKRIAFMTSEQTGRDNKTKNKIETLGWRIITLETAKTIDLVSLFGAQS